MASSETLNSSSEPLSEDSAASPREENDPKGKSEEPKKPEEANGGDENADNSPFECNICLDVARDAVISLCGHLFCWPCLHQWLETRPNRQICPVCKAGISKDKVVPLYGRGNTEQKDPREKVPPRPRGQRPEPENTGPGLGMFNPFNGGQGGGGYQMSFGIGAFPFGFFATNFNIGDNRPEPAQPGTAQYEEEEFLNRVFLWVAMIFIFWLMVA